ncbi:Rho-binding antiterminator [Enterobacterales bacterium AE_CKDN230030158-1A_HGKHYDSX7]
MNAYRPLHCDLHDYLEIACTYQYGLRIELRSGLMFEAAAMTTHTRRNAQGELEEFLQVRVEGASRELRLDLLRAITPLRADARFGRIELNPA